MKIYLARPISGFSYSEVKAYFEQTTSRLAEKFEVLAPLLDAEELRGETELNAHGYTGPTTTNHAIYERDLWLVRQCDVFFLYLPDMPKVSIGCVMELAVAAELRKHTVVCLEGNTHRHAFVLEAADAVFEGLENAFCYLKSL